MYKSFTKGAKVITATIAATGLLLSSGVSAKGPKEDKVPGMPGDMNIVEIAVDNGNFSYLLGAVGCFTDPETGANPIVDLLTGEEDLTLFAPIDQAFIDLQLALNDLYDLGLEATSPEISCLVDDVLGVEGALFTTLAYHLTDGRRFSNSVFNRNNSKDIEMLDGGYITSTTMPSPKLITNIYQMVGPVLGEDGVTPLINIKASNGVIHVIDTVMLPIDPTPPSE
jgi:transforming growth factor-beta-induced protein